MEYSLVDIKLVKLVLRIIHETDVFTVFDLSSIWFDYPGDHLEHRGFAGTVRSDKRHLIAAIHREIYTVIDRFAII